MENPNKDNIFANIEAEKSLLGFLLLNNNAFEEVSEIISKENFFLDIHQKIFHIIIKLLNKSQIADIITVANFASYLDEYKDITTDYLIDLTNSVTTLSSYKDYSSLIYDLYIKRQIINLQNTISSYLKEDISSAEQIQKIERDVFALSEQGTIEKKTFSFEESLNKAFEIAQKARSYANGISGVSTGIDDIDKKLGGLQKSDLIVLAGRPSMGKTALATNIAFNAASFMIEENSNKPGAVVAIFSLEMSAEQIASRILSSEIDKSADHLRKGLLNDAELNRLSIAVNKLKQTPIFIDDTASISTTQLRTKCRRLKRNNDLGLIVIDYIQLLSNDRRRDNRVTEISEITRDLKALAKELDVPVLALSQLSRAVEQRDDKRPLLSDLRESGSIEQDADVVSFVFREEYYLSRKSDSAKTEAELLKQQEVANIAEFIIAKNRHGSIGTIRLYFDANKTKFSNLAIS